MAQRMFKRPVTEETVKRAEEEDSSLSENLKKLLQACRLRSLLTAAPALLIVCRVSLCHQPMPITGVFPQAAMAALRYAPGTTLQPVLQGCDE